jgi:branched-chain amino acid transport system substrate-binding protein
VLDRYQKAAAGQGVDPLGYSYVPFGYAGGQVLAQAVEATKGFDHDKLADYIRANEFTTVLGKLRFGKDGEWAESRLMFSQYQNVTGNDLDQFKDPKKQVVVWPDQFKSGNLIYPYADARKK